MNSELQELVDPFNSNATFNATGANATIHYLWNRLKHQLVGVQHPHAHLLIGVYACAGLAMVLFFTVEDAPWHYSRRVETTYLSVVLFSVYTISVMLGTPVGDFENTFADPLGICLYFRWVCILFGIDRNTGVLRDYADFSQMVTLSGQHVLMLLIMIFIMQHFVRPSAWTAYYDEQFREGNRERLVLLAEAQSQIVRATREVNDCVRQLEDVLERSWILPTSNLALCLACLGVLMLTDIVATIPSISKFSYFILQIFTAIMYVAALVTLVRAWRLHGQISTKVTHILKSVIESNDSEALNYFVSSVSLRCLLDCSGALKELLTWDPIRLKLLGTREKAMCIYVLQNVGLYSSRRRQEAVKHILLSTFSEELTQLKSLLDGTGSYHNLYKLVYYDISSHAIRSKILRHFLKQSKVVRRLPHHIPGIKVCSDMDDTLISSGGHFPSGCDRTYPKGVVYPGCLTLFRILDTGWRTHRTSNLAFLSARPHVYKSWAENKSYDYFRELLNEGRLHSMPTMLPGQLALGLWAMLTYPCLKTRAWKRVGELKYETYKRFARLYLEYDFVFCGDDGQGDLWAGERMTAAGRSELTIDEFMDESDEDPSSSESDSDIVPHHGTSVRTIFGGAFCAKESDSDDSSCCACGSNAAQVDSPNSLRGAAPNANQTERVLYREHGDGERLRRQFSTATISEGALSFRAVPTHDDERELAPSLDGSYGRTRTGVSCRGARTSGGRIRCVLIHKVLDRDKCLPLTMADDPSLAEGLDEDAWGSKIIFHGTYVGAAVALHRFEPALVSIPDLLMVCKDAVKEFEETRLMYANDQVWDLAERQLDQDLQKANELLIQHHVPPVCPLRSREEVVRRSLSLRSHHRCGTNEVTDDDV